MEHFLKMAQEMATVKPLVVLTFSIYVSKKYIFYIYNKTLLTIASKSKAYFYEALSN